ncbi:MAG: DNA N-6-adenine-methyltransferase [Promethearchaeota archaeon]
MSKENEKTVLRPYMSRTEDSEDIWETPWNIFELINKRVKKEYGREITIDICASKDNAKHERYYTEKENGLIQDLQGEIAFCNPPFIEIEKWVEKCYKEGLKPNTIVVALLRVSPDTEYFHKYVMKADQIWFLKGRVWYLINGVEKKDTNFASMVVIFTKNERETPFINTFIHKKKDLNLQATKKLDQFIKKIE